MHFINIIRRVLVLSKDAFVTWKNTDSLLVLFYNIYNSKSFVHQHEPINNITSNVIQLAL